LITTSGLAPAYADAPADPVFSSLDSLTAGHLTGSISSPSSPEIYVRFSNSSGDTYQHLTLTGDTDTFDLPTWGYGGLTNIYAYTCLTADQNVGECSAETVVGTFTPTDVALTPTWSTDATVGPADQVTVDLGDPGDLGGGALFGQWSDDNPAPQDAPFPVPHDGLTVVPIRDGTGVVHLLRCDNSQRDHCVEETVSDSYTVKKTATAAIGPVTGVSSASPTTTFDVTTTGAGAGDGSYKVTWQLELASAPGTAIPGYGTTTASAPLASGVAQDVPLDATDLPTGDYNIVGTITVIDGAYGTYTDLPMTGGTLHSSGDITPPDVTSIVTSPTKIYPLISGNSTYKSSTKITVTGAGVPDVAVVSIYQQSTNTLVRTRTLTPVDATHGTAVWDGRRYNGTPVSSGTYQIKVRDSAGNYSATVGTLVVSGYRLVTKTWTRTFTPAGTLADKYIGRCSTLRLPSLRGWYHSLGYYANTRCSSQTNTDSLISTLHSTFLPSKGVVSYVDIRVNVYGGAARAKPGSKARIRYLHVPKSAGQQGYWFDDKTVSSTLGTHAGYTSPASSMVFKEDNSFAWGFYTGFGYQYDVKSFTVVLHYKALG
jgi:hypothetical protein